MPLKLIHYRSGLIFVAAAFFLVAFPAQVIAVESVRLWRATPARPYVLRGAERRLLDRAEQFLADGQWDDAVAAVTRLLEAENFAVVAVDEQRYVSLSEYCHRLLAKLPGKPLARYRSLVDATAKSWYRQGIAERNADQLQRVVDQYFCSRWGDDALFALGEFALQRGDYQAARNAWRQIGPHAGAYPDTDLSLAAVQARLVLVSVRESDWQRAERELAGLRKNYPEATGRLGGREVVFAEQLASLLEQARQWPSVAASEDWRTFAANSQRTNAQAAPNPAGPYELVWSQPIANEQLSIFPVVVNDLVIYQDATAVRALNLADGQLVFATKGSVFQTPPGQTGWLGQVQYTLSATDRFVFGTTTTPLGPHQKSGRAAVPSTCWSLDLARGGALEFQQQNDEPMVAFVGAPLVIEERLFVAVRGNGQTTRAGVACYDLSTGEQSWLRWLCRGNSPATGWTNELVNNLLTYDAGVVYVNTNLGAIAAVRANEGQVLWLYKYQRQNAELSAEGSRSYYRGPNPCVYYRGVVYALPTDGMELLALDAFTGRQLWKYPVTDSYARLVGVADSRVILVNKGLQACDRHTGKLAGEVDELLLTGWPALRDGEGVGHVLWPHETWASFYDLTNAGGHYDGFDLPELGGANLLMIGNYLVTAGPSQLSVYRFQSRTISSSQDIPQPSTE